MAAPVLTVTRTPAGVVTPGTQVTFTVTATDSDARDVTYTFVGTDSTGASAQVTQTIVVSDPVTVEGSVSDPADVATLSQGSGNLWHSTV